MADDDRIRAETDHLFELGFRRRPTPTGEPQDAALIPQLQQLEGEFREVAREARVVTQGLSRVQFNWRPALGQWSIAECLGHLNILGSEQLAVIDAGIREARAQGWFAAGPFQVGFLGGRFISATEPPVRRRRQAERHFVPESDQSAEITVPAVVDLQEQLLGRVRLANGLDLARIRVRAPGSRLLRLNLLEFLLYLAAHEHRHVVQAWQVRRNPLFPKAAPTRTGAVRIRQ
jgi:DinB superfamily